MWELVRTYKETIQKILTEGDELLKNRKFEGARDLLTRALKEHPKDEHIIHKIGNTFLQEENLEEAKKHYQQALDINPDFLKPLVALGLIASREGDRKKMNELFDEALKKDSKNANIYAFKGRAYQNMQDLDKALEFYNKALELDPNNEDARNGLVFALAFSRDFEKAETLIEESLKKDKDNPAILSVKGFILAIKGNTEEALEIFQKIQEAHPTLPLPWSLLADNYIAENKFDKAEIFLKKDLETSPNNEQTWFQLAFVYNQTNKLKETADALEKVIELNPQNMQARKLLATLGMKQDEVFDEDAMEDRMDLINRAFNLGDDDQDKSLNYRTIDKLIKKKEFDKAIELCENELESNPETQSVLNMLGDVYFAKGDYDRAVVYFKQHADQLGEAYWMYLKIGDTYVTKGDYEVAMKTYEDLKKKYPDNNSVHENIGDLLKLQSRYKEALENYLKVDSYVEIKYKIGDIYRLLENNEKALELYSEALKENFNDRYYEKEDFGDIVTFMEKELLNKKKSKYLNILAVLSALKGDNGKAQKFFEESIQIDSANFLTHKLYGQFFKRNRDYENAIIFLEQAYNQQKDDKDEELILQLAECYESNKDLETAIKYYKIALDTFGDKSDTLTKLGKSFEGLKQFDKAETYFRKAISMLKPEESESSMGYFLKSNYEHLAKALEGQNKWQEVIEIYEKLLKNDSENHRVLYDLGVAYDNNKSGRKAEECYDKIIKLRPKDWFSIQNIASKHFENKRHKKAIEAYEILLELGQDSERIRTGLGFCYFLESDLEQAEKHLKKAIEYDYDFSVPHHLLGDIYAFQEKHEDALFHFKRVLEIEPDNEDVMNKQAEILSLLGDKQSSRDLYLRSLGLDEE